MIQGGTLHKTLFPPYCRYQVYRGKGLNLLQDRQNQLDKLNTKWHCLLSRIGASGSGAENRTVDRGAATGVSSWARNAQGRANWCVASGRTWQRRLGGKKTRKTAVDMSSVGLQQEARKRSLTY